MSQGVAFWTIDFRLCDCYGDFLWFTYCWHSVTVIGHFVPPLCQHKSLFTTLSFFFVFFFHGSSSSSTWPLPEQVRPFHLTSFVCLCKSDQLSQDSKLHRASLLIKQFALPLWLYTHTHTHDLLSPSTQTQTHFVLHTCVYNRRSHSHTQGPRVLIY